MAGADGCLLSSDQYEVRGQYYFLEQHTGITPDRVRQIARQAESVTRIRGEAVGLDAPRCLEAHVYEGVGA